MPNLRRISHGSSPHTRGAPVLRQAADAELRIIPAYAGSTHHFPQHCGLRGDHPRIRGEHAAERHRLPVQAGIIPAYAGSTAASSSTRRKRPDHPRIRGEHHSRHVGKRAEVGSSPHTRGAHRHRPARRHRDRIIPAYAGSTSPGSAPSDPGKDHPRIRGEHPWTSFAPSPYAGSSPHTRGARHLPRRPGVVKRIIPAYAGSTPNRMPAHCR